IRSEPRSQYTYIILLTALSDKGSYLDGMHAGADDLVVKPFDEELLATRLHVAARILALHDTLRRQAMHDSLTGVWNRGAIMDGLKQSFDQAHREGTSLGVVLADIDRFKQINDTLGHMTGDAVLKEVVNRLRVGLRSYDKIGRYGGEEFLIVSPGCASTDAVVVAERLRGSVASSPVVVGERTLQVTLSLGVAVSSQVQRLDVDTLVSSADAALYRAKNAGRNRVELAP
ncbi:MAG TPA: diguanylate cyclase, partial [Polyangiales bacterium]|nr:diguanylate cyclase [Polyangiales bacterium]